MLFYFDDNTSGAAAYSTGWRTYIGDGGGVNASSWYGGTFHSCSASSELSTAVGCNATITFSGTKIWVIGDWNPAQGSYYCALLNEQQPWRWYNGSTLSSPYPGQTGLNHTRCQISGLENKQHTLLFGQTYDGVAAVDGNGITIDYYVVDNATDSTTSTLTWASDFIAGEPDPGYGWSIQVDNSRATSSAVSSFTSSSASASSTSGSSSSNSTAIGVGVGVSVGAVALLALLAAWFFLRRRRRMNDAATIVTEPHHELKAHSPQPSGGAGGSDGGVVPYRSTASGYAPSQFGLPKVQESPTSNGVAPYYTPSAFGGSTGAGLDSPATFRPRG